MATIVGLDLSLVRSGIAVLTDGRPTLVRSVGHAGVAGANYRHRSRRITSQCQAVIATLDCARHVAPHGRGYQIVRDCRTCGHAVAADGHDALVDLAVIEDQLAHGPMLPSALDRSALWWGIYSALTARGIPVAVVNPTTLKVWTTGHYRADKDAMLAEVRDWWPAYASRITNHDQADALALATIGAYHCGDPVPFKTKDRHAATLDKIDFPERATA